MSWDNLLDQLKEALNAAWGWLEGAFSTVQSYLAENLPVWLDWLKENLGPTWEWLVTQYNARAFADLTSDQWIIGGIVVCCILILMVTLRFLLSSSIGDPEDSEPAAEPEPEQVKTTKVLYQGRLTVVGHEDDYVAEKRRDEWRKKVMTPVEQQRYVDSVNASKDESSEQKTGLPRRMRPSNFSPIRWIKRLGYLAAAVVVLIAIFSPPPEGATPSAFKVQLRPDSALVPARKARETKPATPTALTQKYSFSGLVVKVTDGDTITVRANGRDIKVRLHGIDTPEMKQIYGKNAKRALNRMLNGEKVGVRRIDTDRYGRTVGVVFFNDKNINLEMVCAGHAWWYERYAPKDKAMKKCHRNARVMGLGLWKDQHPVPPWEWRRR